MASAEFPHLYTATSEAFWINDLESRGKVLLVLFVCYIQFILWKPNVNDLWLALGTCIKERLVAMSPQGLHNKIISCSTVYIYIYTCGLMCTYWPPLCTYLQLLLHFLVAKLTDNCSFSCLSGRGRGRATGWGLDGRGKKAQVNPFKRTQVRHKYSVLLHRQDKRTYACYYGWHIQQ